MSLPVAIAVIVLLDAALIGMLVFVMSRASRLAPHVSSSDGGAAQTPRSPSTQSHPARPARHAGPIGSPALPARS